MLATTQKLYSFNNYGCISTCTRMRKHLDFCRPSYTLCKKIMLGNHAVAFKTCPTLHPREPFLAAVLSILQHSFQGNSLKKNGVPAHAPRNKSAKYKLKRITIQEIIVPLSNTSNIMRSIAPGQRNTKDKVRTLRHLINASNGYYAYPSRVNQTKRRYTALN